MARFSNVNVNPDLQKERDKGTFDTEKLTHLLDDGEWLTSKRREMESIALGQQHLVEGPEYQFLSRPEQFDDAMRRSVEYIKLLRERSINDAASSYFLRNLIFPNTVPPISLHSSMFIPTLENQCTPEQKDKWLPKAYEHDIIGTYAQTELGHGTNLKKLETTATYDEKTQEFVVHSPTLTSIKWWPGSLGKTANYAVVMAMLFTKRQNHGPHAFVVQLRDLDTHLPLPGIELGDIGPKLGYNTIDNGFLRLTYFRIPRGNMLMKNSEVLADGTYVKKSQGSKMNYSTMVFTRAMIVTDVTARGLAQAVTIAIRYSCIRRQSEIKPGEPECQIIDFQTQQFKLFPMLATAYAIWFAGNLIRMKYFMLNYEIQLGNLNMLPELHATSAGLKAFCSNVSSFGIEHCRLACGGHGYSQASGFPKLYTATTAACTYEGENTVLFLQTARYLVKAYRLAAKNEPLDESVTYLTETSSRCSFNSDLDVDMLLKCYQHRARRLVEKAVKRLDRLQSSGHDPAVAWNLASVSLVKAAQAHCHLCVVNSFIQKLTSVDDRSVTDVLLPLLQLYATYGIYNYSGDFVEGGYMTSNQLNDITEAMMSLLPRIRVNAVALVDAFDFTDQMLCSVLGRYDGNVYENLYKWAQKSPLNKTEVHDSFYKYVQPALKNTKSKL